MIWHSIVELFIGSNTPNPEAASTNSAGVVIHETKAVKIIENQLSKKEQHVEDSLKMLSMAVKKDEKNLFDEIHQVKVKLQLSETKGRILEILHSLIELGDIKTTIMESPELQSIIETINKNLTETEIPRIHTEQLIKLSTCEAEDTDNSQYRYWSPNRPQTTMATSAHYITAGEGWKDRQHSFAEGNSGQRHEAYH